ncbi:MAG: hypothetical protein E7371_01720 [Clostridiales bacterium]|nr:hypothetical protein [Clostridiales bacterium]
MRYRKHKRQSADCRSFYKEKNGSVFRIHPLFLIAGIWYAFKGELFLFLLSALVAVQHECAHAFASARLGYKLNKIVLMPFGAVIDGDLRGISFKDEIYVALCGPLCNLCTAGIFIAIWWLTPTMYAFTDTACLSSLTIALVNLLPAYPLDGGRILKCALARAFVKRYPNEDYAVKKAENICRILTLFFASVLLVLFAGLCARKQFHFTLLAFSLFLAVGTFGNRDKKAVYDKMDFSCRDGLARGIELRRVAVLDTCTVKNALRFLSRENYLVFEVFDCYERHLFDLPQNAFFELFSKADSPYETLGNLWVKFSQQSIEK